MTHTQEVALVSGSTKGIGKAIAQQLVQDGYIVIQNSRSLVVENEIIGREHMKADVTIESECKELISRIIEKYGKLNLLVCNVGSGKTISKNLSVSDSWRYFLSVNLNSTTYLVNSALSALIETKGNVVAVSSICAVDPSIEAPIGYTTAKAGLEMFMKTMALRYASQGLRFNVVAPGNVLFEGSVWDQKLVADKVEVAQYLTRRVPLGRLIEPEEIAIAVSFLSGTYARNITGDVLPVDGGQSI